jgi:hypothetical protein
MSSWRRARFCASSSIAADLQRLANDPNGDEYNSLPVFNACSTESTCVNYPNQPKGVFIHSPTSAELRQAFLAISSQILRLSHWEPRTPTSPRLLGLGLDLNYPAVVQANGSNGAAFRPVPKAFAQMTIVIRDHDLG